MNLTINMSHKSTLKKSIGRIELILNWNIIGDDYVLTLTGGQKHIGATAIGLYDKKHKRSSASVISIPGHRDEGIALTGAREISKITQTVTVFIVGIHLDNITEKEITEIIETSNDMIKKFIELIKDKK